MTAYIVVVLPLLLWPRLALLVEHLQALGQVLQAAEVGVEVVQVEARKIVCATIMTSVVGSFYGCRRFRHGTDRRGVVFPGGDGEVSAGHRSDRAAVGDGIGMVMGR